VRVQDPQPENITGEKVQRHVFKHEIKWGQVAIGVAALATVYVVYQGLSGEDEEDGPAQFES
jgi:hypothetical protein